MLTALTVCFLWLERLPLRPGLGIAAMLALALAGALPLASRGRTATSRGSTTRRSPRGSAPTSPVQFNWNHTLRRRSPGRATAPRCCASTPAGPSYWKVADLDDFDGEAWLDTGSDRLGATSPEFDLPDGWQGQPAAGATRCA